MTPTEEYVHRLERMKAGELGLLRLHAGQSLDVTLTGFDLFTGLWWPLRQQNARAPRREVAWLIAKLFAHNAIQHAPGRSLAAQLRRCEPRDKADRDRFRQTFDQMLVLPVEKIEVAVRSALDTVARRGLKIDWVRLTDDLSVWERQSTRRRWAEDYLNCKEGE